MSVLNNWKFLPSHLPLPENDASQINMTQPQDYSFAFEVGLKPAFQLPDLSSLTPTRYQIIISEDMLNEEIERLQQKNGTMTDPETVTGDENVLNVTFQECDASGQTIGRKPAKGKFPARKIFCPRFPYPATWAKKPVKHLPSNC